MLWPKFIFCFFIFYTFTFSPGFLGSPRGHSLTHDWHVPVKEWIKRSKNILIFQIHPGHKVFLSSQAKLRTLGSGAERHPIVWPRSFFKLFILPFKLSLFHWIVGLRSENVYRWYWVSLSLSLFHLNVKHCLGDYECQISTTPVRSLKFLLQVVGESQILSPSK